MKVSLQMEFRKNVILLQKPMILVGVKLIMEK